MGYHQPERSSSSGAVVAVLVVVLLIFVLGGLFVVGVGAYFLLAPAPLPQATVVEEPARARMLETQSIPDSELKAVQAEVAEEQGEAMTQMRSATAGSSASDSKRAFDLSISQDGTVSVAGQPTDLDELRSRLEKLKTESGTGPRVRIDVAPECPHEHLVSVLDACDDIASEVAFRMSPQVGGEAAVDAD